VTTSPVHGSGKKGFLRKAKKALKVAIIAMSFVLVTIAAVSKIVLESKNDWLMDQIQSFMSESQSGEMEVESIGFAIFQNFPDITVELNGISYYEHADTLRVETEIPILRARQLFVAFKLLPLIRDELIVSEITVTDARLVIVSYSNGKRNIELALVPPTKAGGSPKIVSRQGTGKSPHNQTRKPGTTQVTAPVGGRSLKIDIEQISLRNVLLSLHSYGGADTTRILIEDIQAKLNSENSVIKVSLESKSAIQKLMVKDYSIPAGEVTIKTQFQFDQSTQRLTINQGEMNVDFLSATFSGSYAHKDARDLDINIDASSNDLKLLSKIIRPNALRKSRALLKHGDIYVRGRLFGKLDAGAPQFDITFGVNDLRLLLPRNLGTISGVGFDGSFSSGNRPDLTDALVEVTRLRGKIPGGYLRGGFSIRNLKEPYARVDMAAQLALDGYDEVFQVDAIKDIHGIISARARFEGPLAKFAMHEMDSNRSSAIVLNNVSFILNKTNEKISGLSGKVENQNNQAVVNVKFNYGESELTLDVTIGNLAHALVSGERNINSTGHIHSTQLFTSDFIFDTTKVARIRDRISDLDFDFAVQVLGRTETPPEATPTLSFTVTNLKSTFDKLPNIVKLDATGSFTKSGGGIRLDLTALNLILPQGAVNVTGDLNVSSQRSWQFNARAKSEQLPWIYVSDVVAEIAPESEPSAKNLPRQTANLLTADIDVSAAIITYPFDFERLQVRDSRLQYTLDDTKLLRVDKLNVNLDQLTFIHPVNSGRIVGLKSSAGVISLERLAVPGVRPIDLKLDIRARNDTAQIAFTSTTHAARSEHGELFLDISQREFTSELKYQVNDADLAPFVEKIYKKKLITGLIDYKLDLKASGSTLTRIKETLTGTVEVTSDSLQLYGVDIDKVLRKFEKTQNFNLTDVGALLIAGPVGLVVTKGANFVSLASVDMHPSEKTEIRTFLGRWAIEDLQLRTMDVALATPQNRIVFNGVIDVGNDSIPGLTISVVDEKGCALMDQQVFGKTTALKTGKLNIAKTMSSSVVNFANAIVGKECVPVYTGEVEAPQKRNRRDK
jgi:hypothetical protein